MSAMSYIRMDRLPAQAQVASGGRHKKRSGVKTAKAGHGKAHRHRHHHKKRRRSASGSRSHVPAPQGMGGVGAMGDGSGAAGSHRGSRRPSAQRNDGEGTAVSTRGNKPHGGHGIGSHPHHHHHHHHSPQQGGSGRPGTPQVRQQQLGDAPVPPRRRMIETIHRASASHGSRSRSAGSQRGREPSVHSRDHRVRQRHRGPVGTMGGSGHGRRPPSRSRRSSSGSSSPYEEDINSSLPVHRVPTAAGVAGGTHGAHAPHPNPTSSSATSSTLASTSASPSGNVSRPTRATAPSASQVPAGAGDAAATMVREVGINVLGKVIKQLPFNGMGLDAGKLFPVLEQLAVSSCAGAALRSL